LLHDIGMIVLDAYFVETTPLFYQSIHDVSRDSISLEKDAVGIDHQEVGSLLAEQWLLPENLRQSIAFHHAPDLAAGYSELAHTVYLADLLATHYLAGQELERTRADNITASLHVLGLSAADLAAVVGKVPWAMLQSGNWQTM